MIKAATFFFTLLLIASVARPQIGGSYSYAFLNVPASARVAALGGTYIAVKDNDLNCALQNPAQLNSSMSHTLLLNGVLYFDGVKFGDAAYAFEAGKAGTFMANMHYASYGQFLETDEAGLVLGTFHAADYNLNLGWGYRLNEFFSIGAALKTIYSNFYTYNSFGLATDLGVAYNDSDAEFSMGLVAKNIGTQLKNYVQDDNEPLPGEVDFAATKRLIHTPFRFTITYKHLEKFDLTYTDPNNASQIDPLTGETQVTTYGFFDKLAWHFVGAAELLLSQSFHLRFAYNFERRKELRLDSSPGLAGISYGFGIRINKFSIGYGRASYHLAGAANHFTVSTNLADFVKK